MRKIFLLLSALLFISCSSETPGHSEVQTAIDEVVDVRIHSNGTIRFNGSTISDSSLPSHIKSLNITESTRARVIIDENSPTGLVFKTQNLLYRHQVRRIRFLTLSSKEFKNYNQRNVHIDVLRSGEILFNGRELFPEDLKTGLKNIEITPSTKFIVSVSEKATVGPVFDTLEYLAAADMTKITYEDLSKYLRM